ncbi:adenosylmethionine--8-amino-7-oxononanoate transaminase [Nocardiopsis sp. YSL2]|uniref:adenosylmethionine--8-amino-7-oxononanoate transaminase n=1 Tax=Nocardiopsis sp. YSL2 TaxID=2939492 RepID=UPI0026F444E4|nr:adenosylmethionine--8-amino-7-oxononanoate transaminase [Nocardiopsis sp. YSL2]
MTSTPVDPARVRAADRAHLWHPYTTVPAAEEPYVVTGARGTRLELWSEGETHSVVDGMASWWSAIHGYGHPALDTAVRAQLDAFGHVMFGGLTHGPAAELGRTLVGITPDGLEHVFLADSGSVSVEVAMKMCLQYHRSTGSPERRRFLTWRGGYHGDTFHAMSVCDPDGGMHSLWGDVLPRQVHGPAPTRRPPSPVGREAGGNGPPPSTDASGAVLRGGFDTAVDPSWVAEFERLAAENADTLAAVIVEPVVQGAGGMRFHHPGYLRELRRIADEYGLLLVFDEIATGFGRTGELFAADHAGVTPDIMCLGKALTGGYLTLAATLCTGRVARGIAEGEVPVLAHGPTFMGNPLACATALASVELLTGGDWRADVRRIESGLRTGLAAAEQLPGVREVRVLGAIGVVELDEPVRMGEATRAAVASGVWLRPFRNQVYAMPPYVCTDEDVGAIAAGMVAAARASLEAR